MPALVPTIRSGSSAAIRSNSKPSATLSTSGSAPSSSGCAQGQVADGCSPYHSVTATGTTPSSRRMSCSVTPTDTTRSGGAGTVVWPYWCATTAGNDPSTVDPVAAGDVGASAAGEDSPAAQPAVAAVARTATTVA